jgi:hypothetical protein
VLAIATGGQGRRTFLGSSTCQSWPRFIVCRKSSLQTFGSKKKKSYTRLPQTAPISSCADNRPFKKQVSLLHLHQNSFCVAKLNQRTHSSAPPHHFGNDCKHLREHACISEHDVTFITILQCVSNLTILQFYNFQASLNHRANACSCLHMSFKNSFLFNSDKPFSSFGSSGTKGQALRPVFKASSSQTEH